MVDYSNWVKAVHEAYRAEGGTYAEGTASEIVQIAAEFWNQNKDELRDLAYREAVRLARRSLEV